MRSAFHCRVLRSCAIFCVVLATVLAANAQRLPDGVTPQHYALALAPDLKSATFSGDERIDIVLAASSNHITLNAADITFASVTAQAEAGPEQTAQIADDKATQQVTFTFPQALPAGPAQLRIRYSGVLNGMLRGFYLSKTPKRNYAVTQFEPTDARRAFPAFDEPAMKATFNVTLTIDKADTAISNTPVVSDTPGPQPGKHTLAFATTPKMSTYLVAFLVGDFQCTSGESDGVAIRACATPDKQPLTQYAVTVAEFVLHHYNTYFGIKYPLPKLDMVAIPDFEAGAMENFGCIVYRETDLLVDAPHASVTAKQAVAVTVAHEMAHQWFGDLVTMQWWNNIWLNEGFASWMEDKLLAAWKPEWQIPAQQAVTLSNILNLDAHAVTRTIRAEANTPDEINEMFDGITYSKGAAILGMVESYLGEEQFRKGVHNYLQAHQFANATAEEFWNAQTAASGKPVDKIMESFIGLPGVPLLTFGEPTDGAVPVTQQRFFLSPSAAQPHAADAPQVWTVPVCLNGASDTDCPLLSTAQGRLPVPSGSTLFGNARGKGYYRSMYPKSVQQKLAASIESLSPPERISLLGDTWAIVRSGRGAIADPMELAVATRLDRSPDVMEVVRGQLDAVSRWLVTTPAERSAFQLWVRNTWGPPLHAMGVPTPGEDPQKALLRTALFTITGRIGEDPTTLAEARRIAELWVTNPDTVDPNLGPVAVHIAAEHGDVQLFDKLQHVFETSPDPQRSEIALWLLISFRNPDLVQRALTFATSGKVKNQDSPGLIAAGLSGTGTRDATWHFIQTHWPAVQGQLTEMNGAAIVAAAGSFCSADKLAQVKQFYSTHAVHAAARALDRAEAQIQDCVEFRAAQEQNLTDWLSAHGKQAPTP